MVAIAAAAAVAGCVVAVVVAAVVGGIGIVGGGNAGCGGNGVGGACIVLYLCRKLFEFRISFAALAATVAAAVANVFTFTL